MGSEKKTWKVIGGRTLKRPRVRAQETTVEQSQAVVPETIDDDDIDSVRLESIKRLTKMDRLRYTGGKIVWVTMGELRSLHGESMAGFERAMAPSSLVHALDTQAVPLSTWVAFNRSPSHAFSSVALLHEKNIRFVLDEMLLRMAERVIRGMRSDYAVVCLGALCELIDWSSGGGRRMDLLREIEKVEWLPVSPDPQRGDFDGLLVLAFRMCAAAVILSVQDGPFLGASLDASTACIRASFRRGDEAKLQIADFIDLTT